jgi:hypothetical protein
MEIPERMFHAEGKPRNEGANRHTDITKGREFL